jgi:hypothetical protein
MESPSLRKTAARWNVLACDGRSARINRLGLLPNLFERVQVSIEVYNGVVIAGAGMPGAKQVSQADWIEVIPSGMQPLSSWRSRKQVLEPEN